MDTQLFRLIAIVVCAMMGLSVVSGQEVSLIDAARAGDAASVRSRLHEGVDPNTTNPNTGSSALSHAAGAGGVDLSGKPIDPGDYLGVLELLLDAGADPDGNREDPGDHPLYTAAITGKPEAAGLLIEAGAGSTYGMNGVCRAAYIGDSDELDTIVQAGTDVDGVVARDWSCLIVAAAAGLPQMAERLLNAGADPNQEFVGRLTFLPPIARFTPLMIAARNGNAETARVLIEGGADVRSRSQYGYTAKRLAVREGSAAAVQVLLDADPGANTVPILSSLLYQATERGRLETVGVLLEAGADPQFPVKRGRSSIEEARRRGLSEIVNLMSR